MPNYYQMVKFYIRNLKNFTELYKWLDLKICADYFYFH